jgi:hypothetical protein
VAFNYFIVERLEVFSQGCLVRVVLIVNGLHAISRKGSREDVDKLEEGLKRLVKEVGEVVLNLLGPLNVDAHMH